jgi:hypothetical protein
MSRPQPTEAHRKLWTALYNLAHREIFEDYAESSEGPATQLIADSEARAVERANLASYEQFPCRMTAETYIGYGQERDQLAVLLTAEREKVRVLREALSRRHDEQSYHCQYVEDALAATEVKP